MPSVCYRKVNGKYYSPSEYKKLKARHLYRRPAYGGKYAGEQQICPYCGKRCPIGHECQEGRRELRAYRRSAYGRCPRCCRTRCKNERVCEDCGYPYWQGRN